jgi:hypothetical protein
MPAVPCCFTSQSHPRQCATTKCCDSSTQCRKNASSLRENTWMQRLRPVWLSTTWGSGHENFTIFGRCNVSRRPQRIGVWGLGDSHRGFALREHGERVPQPVGDYRSTGGRLRDGGSWSKRRDPLLRWLQDPGQSRRGVHGGACFAVRTGSRSPRATHCLLPGHADAGGRSLAHIRAGPRSRYRHRLCDLVQSARP